MWDGSADVIGRTVDVLVSRLRNKLLDGDGPRACGDRAEGSATGSAAGPTRVRRTTTAPSAYRYEVNAASSSFR